MTLTLKPSTFFLVISSLNVQVIINRYRNCSKLILINVLLCLMSKQTNKITIQKYQCNLQNDCYEN